MLAQNKAHQVDPDEKLDQTLSFVSGFVTMMSVDVYGCKSQPITTGFDKCYEASEVKVRDSMVSGGYQMFPNSLKRG